MNARNSITKLITGVWILLAAGCHGDRPHFTPTDPPPGQGQAATLTVGGSTFGLLGTLVLEINGGDALTLTADGKFAFSNALPSGSSYSVAVQSQPANQICTVSSGTGTLTNANITTVTVNCSTLTRNLGGTVVGLTQSETVILQDNGGDNLTVSGNGGFTFTTPVAQSARYDVTVLTQPATQTCTVTNGSGTAGTADITDVQVTCAINAYKVGGAVSGLSGTVVLQNNGTDDLSVNSDGAFAFSTPLAQGASYDITVLTQPAEQTCAVADGSGTMGGADLSNISVSCVTNTTALATTAGLALSVVGLTEYGVAGTPSSGLSRSIVITNTGSYAAYNVSVAAPTWPAGTMSSTTCSSTLAAGASCTITISPGSTPTSDGTNPCSSGTAPLPGVVQVSADNAATVFSNVVILSYGCIYQGGYAYAFDDTTSNTQSVGGQVVTTTDQAPASTGVIWSSTGSGTALDAIFGISQNSTVSSPDPSASSSNPVSGQVACNGSADGACNSNNIYVYYQSGVPTSYYAAGLCKQTISGYSDWFLPAICQLGYGSGGVCGTSSVPAQQNVQSSLVDSNNPGAPTGYYWSSTESSSFPQDNAWAQYLSTAGGNSQSFDFKGSQLGVRCSRSLSP